MKSNNEYKRFLEQIIACVNYGDYYSIKELSNIELKNLEKEQLRYNNGKISILNKMEKNELKYIVKEYSEYINNIIEESQSISAIKEKIISINEFVLKKINKKLK